MKLSELPDRSPRRELEVVADIVGRLAPLCLPGEAPGDDAAILTVEDDTVLVCIDALVEGVHFDLEISDPTDVGWKAVAVNASDVAAMGGRPTHAVVSVNVSDTQGPQMLDGVMDGVIEASRRFDLYVVGGDVGGAPCLVVVVALMGKLPPGSRAVRRCGARPGDALLVTGVLGGSAAGLELARGGARDHPLVARHRRPNPRIAEGLHIARAGATSMIDISDGLLLDAWRLAQSSKVALSIDVEALPVVEAVLDGEKPDPMQARRLALVGGDDYELLFTLPRDKLPKFLEAWEDSLAPVSVIGSVEEGTGLDLRPDPAIPPDIRRLGWEHFS